LWKSPEKTFLSTRKKPMKTPKMKKLGSLGFCVLALLAIVTGCNKERPKTLFDFALDEVKEGTSAQINTTDMTGVGDEQIKLLEGVEGLVELRLNRSSITDEGIRSILKIPDLKILSLGETHISDDSLAILANHPTLVHLSLDQTRITDKALEHVATIPNLEELFLWKGAITDQGCTKLAKMPKLKRLHLDETQITGKGFRELKTLKNLKYLSVWRTGVSGDDATEFNKTLPDCKVNR